MSTRVKGRRRLRNASVSISITRIEGHCIKIELSFEGIRFKDFKGIKIDISEPTNKTDAENDSDFKNLLVESFLEGKFPYLSYDEMDKIINKQNLRGV